MSTQISIRSSIVRKLAIAVCLLALATPALAQQQPVTHMVARGETLTRIAARYGLTWRDLAVANSLSNPNVLSVGQILVIPIVPVQRIHTVARGETLRRIAALYGTTWQAIATANNLTNPNLISVGQVLLIPAAGVPVVQPVFHTVAAGETLTRIAIRYNVDKWAIARANGLLNLNLLKVGQVLLIPR